MDPELQRQPDLSDLVIKEDAFPTRFAVEVSADCNLACSMCHHPDMKRPKGRMPLPLWQKCADEIAKLGDETECWFSFCGEPLMEPDLLFSMLDYGRRAGLRSMNINTNGQLYRPHMAAPLLDSGVKRIVFGIDGFSKETYERARKGGDRDLVFANLEHLLAERRSRDTGPEIIVQFIIMHYNQHECDDFKAHWLERGATVKVRHQLSWGGQRDAKFNPLEERLPCAWALTMMHVFWDGRVPRCPGDTEGDDSVGNAWDHSLEDLWQQLGQYRALHKSHDFGALPDACQDCTDWMVGKAQLIDGDSTETSGTPE